MSYPNVFDLNKGKVVINRATRMFGHITRFRHYNQKHIVEVLWADEDEPTEHEIKEISW